MKKNNLIVFSLLFLFLSSNLHEVFGQKQSFKDKGITFMIHSRGYFSKKLADSLDIQSKKFYREFLLKTGKHKDSIEKEVDNFLRTAYYDSRSVKLFRVNPTEYIEMNIRNVNDSIFTEQNFTNITKISRDSLKISFFFIKEFKVSDTKFTKKPQSFSSYKFVSENKKKTKEIAGYTCYEVILESEFKRLVLYVTEEISLNYHPIINDPSIFRKYYPLLVRQEDKRFPKRSYKESFFSLGRLIIN